MFDIQSYEVGAGYPEPGQTEVESGVIAPSTEPAAPAASKADSDRYSWMKAEGAKRAAAAGAAPAPKKGEAQPEAEEQPAGEQEQEQHQTETQPFELQVPSFVDNRAITEERSAFLNEFSALAPQVGI